MHETALYGNYAASKFLLETGLEADVIDNKGRPRYTRLHNVGHVPIVRLLIEHNASLAQKANNGITPTDLALDNQHINVAQVLLQYGAP